eukprot:TRINITY_DN1173_c0_g2_i1.p1 TRINITY_DN1173_c0_g2~~TRINITY_DN1173_c0_g2_i1.p1  ORF type:complete len:474 (+),score=182.08 TRINITY_DN1173_c0_g2_i1:442-1863(+)
MAKEEQKNLKYQLDPTFAKIEVGDIIQHYCQLPQLYAQKKSLFSGDIVIIKNELNNKSTIALYQGNSSNNSIKVSKGMYKSIEADEQSYVSVTLNLSTYEISYIELVAFEDTIGDFSGDMMSTYIKPYLYDGLVISKGDHFFYKPDVSMPEIEFRILHIETKNYPSFQQPNDKLYTQMGRMSLNTEINFDEDFASRDEDFDEYDDDDDEYQIGSSSSSSGIVKSKGICLIVEDYEEGDNSEIVIHPECAESISVNEGDIMLIQNESNLFSTVAILFVDDVLKEGCIRMNKTIQNNLSISLDETVIINSISNIKYCKEVTIFSDKCKNDDDDEANQEIIDAYLIPYFIGNDRPVHIYDSFDYEDSTFTICSINPKPCSIINYETVFKLTSSEPVKQLPSSSSSSSSSSNSSNPYTSPISVSNSFSSSINELSLSSPGLSLQSNLDNEINFIDPESKEYDEDKALKLALEQSLLF